MKSLVFDTETTGFPLWKEPSSHPNQPHLVQLACAVVDEGEVTQRWSTIVYCPIEVPEEAYRVHGITKAKSIKEGMMLEALIPVFQRLLKSVDRLVAHNARFDFKIMKIAYSRTMSFVNVDSDALLRSIPKFCTMQTAVKVVKLPGRYPSTYKWPKLIEAYKFLIDEKGFEGQHEAGADVDACVKVMLALEDKGHELVRI